MSLLMTLSCARLDRPRRSDLRRARLFTGANGSINEVLVFSGGSIG
jgi:hypothetical protein